MSNHLSTSIRNYFALLVFASFSLSAPLFAEDSTSWAGQAQCVITVQGAGYSHQETQTWTVLGGTPTIQGAFRVYPGTWSVSGGVPRPPNTTSLEAFEYQFPAGEAVSSSHSLSGSNTVPINGSVSPMAPGGSQATAACSWEYTLGGP